MHTERTAEGIYFFEKRIFPKCLFFRSQPVPADRGKCGDRKIEAVQADQKHTKREKAKLTFLHAQKSKDQKRQIIDKHDLTMHNGKDIPQSKIKRFR